MHFFVLLIFVCKAETNQSIKLSLRTTIDLYMKRAEKLKASCKIKPRRVPDNYQIPPSFYSDSGTRPTQRANSQTQIKANATKLPQTRSTPLLNYSPFSGIELPRPGGSCLFTFIFVLPLQLTPGFRGNSNCQRNKTY